VVEVTTGLSGIEEEELQGLEGDIDGAWEVEVAFGDVDVPLRLGLMG